MRIEDAAMYLNPHMTSEPKTYSKDEEYEVMDDGEALVHDATRPRTRAECPTGGRCPFVSCKYHLYLDVNERNGSIKINFDGLEPWHLSTPCALDVAERHREGLKLRVVGEYMGGLTKERIRQIEADALAKMRTLVDIEPETQEQGDGDT